jgi:hypothetical protein
MRYLLTWHWDNAIDRARDKLHAFEKRHELLAEKWKVGLLDAFYK